MKCPDCKGSGIYQGLGAPEPCPSCGGVGEAFPANAEETEAALVMRDAIAKQLDDKKNKPQTGPTPTLGLGDDVYVYDGQWHECVLTTLWLSLQGAIRMNLSVVGSSKCFDINKRGAIYNLTQNRWECAFGCEMP